MSDVEVVGGGLRNLSTPELGKGPHDHQVRNCIQI